MKMFIWEFQTFVQMLQMLHAGFPGKFNLHHLKWILEPVRQFKQNGNLKTMPLISLYVSYGAVETEHKEDLDTVSAFVFYWDRHILLFEV